MTATVPHYGGHCNQRSKRSETEAFPGDAAGVVAGQTGPANLGPDRVDRAGRSHSDLTGKSRAAVTDAPHAAACVVDESTRDAVEIGVGFQREPRPFRGKRATCPARLTSQRLIPRSGSFNHDRRSSARNLPHRLGCTFCLWVRSGSTTYKTSRRGRKDPAAARNSRMTGAERGGEAPSRITPSGCWRRRSCRCGGPPGYRRKPSAPRQDCAGRRAPARWRGRKRPSRHRPAG